MLTRWLIISAMGVYLATNLWAKETLTPQSLMAKSDAVYFMPSAHGVTDLAVDLVIEEFNADPVARDARITYYNAGDGRQRIQVGNIPDSKASVRDDLIAAITPVMEYVMPAPAETSFSGMTTSLQKVSRQFIGVPGTTFYAISGVIQDEQNPVKVRRVILDAEGLLYQLELEYRQQDSNALVARVENIKIGDFWYISTVTTRIFIKKPDVYWWRVEHIEYATVDGHVFPTRFTLEYRDELNKVMREKGALMVSFKDYRINTGAAARALTVMNAAPAEAK